MSTQAKIYMILTNLNNQKCILLTPNEVAKTTPQNPEILYDYGENAILYRNPNDTIILDYFPQSERKNLTELKQILVVEYDVKTKKPAYEYMAKITILNKLPPINNLIKK